MLQFVEDPILICVSHDLASDDVLHELAANARETYRPVVYCKELLPLFVGWNNISMSPFRRYHSSSVGTAENVGQQRSNRFSQFL